MKTSIDAVYSRASPKPHLCWQRNAWFCHAPSFSLRGQRSPWTRFAIKTKSQNGKVHPPTCSFLGGTKNTAWDMRSACGCACECASARVFWIQMSAAKCRRDTAACQWTSAASHLIIVCACVWATSAGALQVSVHNALHFDTYWKTVTCYIPCLLRIPCLCWLCLYSSLPPPERLMERKGEND